MRIYVWFPILASMSLGFSFMNIPPLNHQFMDLLKINYGALSWLLSGLFWTHAIMQLPAGLIADRGDPWKVLALGLVICVVANILPFIKPDSQALAIALRFFLGIGTSLAFLAMIKVLFILAPGEKLAAIQGLQGAGFSFGFVLPYLILPRLGPEAWPYSYLISGAFVLTALAASFLLPRAKLRPSAEPRPISETKVALVHICTSGPIWFLGLFHGLSYGSLNNLGNWVPSIMADLDGRGVASAWAPSAVALLLLGTFGRAFGGKFLTWFSRDRLINGAVLLICLMYLAMGLAGRQYLVLGSALIMALVCGSTYGSIFTLAGAAGVGYAATAMGVMNMIANLFNVLLTLFFGYVREHTGQFSPGLIAVGFIGLAFWFVGRKLVSRVEAETRRSP